MAKLQSSGSQIRLGCKKCGFPGHLTFQCRNFVRNTGQNVGLIDVSSTTSLSSDEEFVSPLKKLAQEEAKQEVDRKQKKKSRHKRKKHDRSRRSRSQSSDSNPAQTDKRRKLKKKTKSKRTRSERSVREEDRNSPFDKEERWAEERKPSYLQEKSSRPTDNRSPRSSHRSSKRSSRR